MRGSIIGLALLLLAGCVDTETEKPAVSSSTSVSTSTSSNANTGLPTGGNGPTGSTDPVDPEGFNDSGEVTYYADPEPTPSPVDNGVEVLNVCGVLYRDFIQNKLFILEDGNQTAEPVETLDGSISGELGRLQYPNDSYNACLDGRRYDADTQGGARLRIEQLSKMDSVANPARPLAQEYAYEVCGQMEQYRSYSGASYQQLQVGSVAYIMQYQVDVVAPTINGSDKIRTCVYSNSTAYNDYDVSFKKFFDVEAVLQ